MPPETSLLPSGLNATQMTPAVWPRKRQDLLPGCGVPELDGSVAAGRGDPRPSGLKTTSTTCPGMALQGEGDLAAGRATHLHVVAHEPGPCLTSAKSVPSGLSRLRL